jgi:hypothetical protein
MNTRDMYHLEDTSDWIGRFEEILKQFDITIASGSVLEAVALDTFKLWEEYQGFMEFSGPAELRNIYVEAMGFHDLLRHILANEEHPSLSQLVPHFRLMNENRFLENARKSLEETKRTRRLSQNMAALSIDQGANKLFELLIALICMRFSQTVTLDDPNHSEGDNPDVIFDYDGKKWAIACKTIHTQSGEGLLALIDSAIEQIENSKAETGFVCLNFKNQIRHEDYWSPGPDGLISAQRVFASRDEFGHALLGEIREDFQRRLSGIESEAISAKFDGKKARPLALTFAQTAGVVKGAETGDNEIPTILGLFELRHFFELPDLRLLTDLNLSMHHVTREQLNDEPLLDLSL